jgi:hypothetical protein
MLHYQLVHLTGTILVSSRLADHPKVVNTAVEVTVTHTQVLEADDNKELSPKYVPPCSSLLGPSPGSLFSPSLTVTLSTVMSRNCTLDDAGANKPLDWCGTCRTGDRVTSALVDASHVSHHSQQGRHQHMPQFSHPHAISLLCSLVKYTPVSCAHIRIVCLPQDVIQVAVTCCGGYL